MKLELHCYHEETDKDYIMEERDQLENNAVSFKCPKCGKETLVFLRLERPQ